MLKSRVGIFVLGLVLGAALVAGGYFGWRLSRGGSIEELQDALALDSSAQETSDEPAAEEVPPSAPKTICATGLPEDLDGFQDEDGCGDPDNDRDGIPDTHDGAPLEVEDADGDRDYDGIPDPDSTLSAEILERRPYRRWSPGGPAATTSEVVVEAEVDPDPTGAPDPKREIEDSFEPRDEDQDRIPDLYDLCPAEAEDVDGFQDRDGCPEPDNDLDGIPDGGDSCPLVPGQDCDAPLEIKGKIFFATGSDRILLPRSAPALDEVLRVLAENPQLQRVEIQGHTDNVGSETTNQELSERRAKSVERYLVEKGVSAARLVPKGFGSTRAVMSNKTEEGRATNRRVEFYGLAAEPEDGGETAPKAP